MDTLAHPATRDAVAPAPVHRRSFSGDDLEQMVRTGIINDNERVELIAGEIIAMSAKGNFHEVVRCALSKKWTRSAPEDVTVFGETPLRLSLTDQPEPDIIVFSAAISLPDLRGSTVDLVVEVSDSSLGYDLGIKSQLYAAFNVREYWVIDSIKLETYVHRDPVAGVYTSVTKHTAGDAITPQAAPYLTTRLAALGFDWLS